MPHDYNADRRFEVGSVALTRGRRISRRAVTGADAAEALDRQRMQEREGSWSRQRR
jgi:hypothetical protein